MAIAQPSGTILAMATENAERRCDGETAWAAAEAYGCDMSLLECSIRKTPAERIQAHSRALAAALALREAMERRAVRP